ncbi:MAG: serine/threonine protein kinase [Deltaproteobacteria bacterium]|nr:serine/threonine protein kinase [Deltaproteobacteria bacterium]
MGTPIPHAPARLGRYELLARLATGGMGEIFLARLEGAAGFEKLVVVKRILPHLADDARFRQMLVDEARVTSKMAHANICQVHELGETDGQLYIVMEYMEGVTLLPLLRKASKEQRPLDFGFIAGVLQQTCDGLHYAHELRERTGEFLGVVHRDVTPSNVFITDSGVAKVLDFGIAKVKDASANTQTGTVKGKYAYMAPEQLRGGAIDRRVDVFALGIVLYEMLALRRLFQRKTDYLTFRAVMEQPMPDVRRYRPDIPEALGEIVMRALDREPDKRFASARQFATAVLDALGSRRPWSQGEIGDFVRASFASDITRRSQQVAIAVHRTDVSGIPSGLGRSTMPLIAHDDSQMEVSDDDDDDMFPSVEETQDEMPQALRVAERYQQAVGVTTNEFVGHTPPPFGADSSTSGVSLQPLTPPIPSATPARSMMWPLVAIAMVLIAGGALFLVWRQQQQQNQQQAVAPIVIQQYSSGASGVSGAGTGATEGEDAALAVAGSGSEVIANPGSGSGPGPGSAVVIKRPPVNPPMTSEAYQRAINAAIDKVKPKLVDCVAKHGLPPVGTVMVMAIGLDGRATSVSFKPVEPDKKFSACAHQVMVASAYPKPSVAWVQEVSLRSR